MTILLFYTDPGSGMMLLQILLAFAASVLFYFRKFFYKVFGRGRSADAVKVLRLAPKAPAAMKTRPK